MRGDEAWVVDMLEEAMDLGEHLMDRLRTVRTVVGFFQQHVRFGLEAGIFDELKEPQ